MTKNTNPNPGQAVDSAGYPVIDPTANVLKLVDEAVTATGAKSMADMGKLIGMVKSKAPNVDGGRIGGLVKSKLNGQDIS